MQVISRNSSIVVIFAGLQNPFQIFKEARRILFYAVIMMATRNAWCAEMELGTRLSIGKWMDRRACRSPEQSKLKDGAAKSLVADFDLSVRVRYGAVTSLASGLKTLGSMTQESPWYVTYIKAKLIRGSCHRESATDWRCAELPSTAVGYSVESTIWKQSPTRSLRRESTPVYQRPQPAVILELTYIEPYRAHLPELQHVHSTECRFVHHR